MTPSVQAAVPLVTIATAVAKKLGINGTTIGVAILLSWDVLQLQIINVDNTVLQGMITTVALKKRDTIGMKTGGVIHHN